MKRNQLALAAALSASMLLAACSSTGPNESEEPQEEQASEASPADLITVNVGVSPTTSGSGFNATLQAGYFEEEGLKVEPKIMQSGSEALPLLLNGEVDFAILDLPGTVVAHQKGIPVKLLFGVTHTPTDGDSTDGIIVLPDSPIERPSDLEGKTVAVSSLVGTPALYLRAAVEADGADPENVNLVEVPQGNTVAAVQDGTVDAGMIFEPFLAQGASEGLRIVTHPGAFAAPGAMQSAYAGIEEYLENNQDVAQRFIAAMQKGNADVEASVNGDGEFIRELVKDTTNIDPDTVDVMVLPSYRSGAFSLEAADIMLDLLHKQGYIDEAVSSTELVWEPLVD